MNFRPRFSVRTLAIFVTLVCAYFGAWEATKRNGVNNDLDTPWLTAEPAGYDRMGPPMIFGFWGGEKSPAALLIARDEPFARTYYLWLFGPRMKLLEYSTCVYADHAYQENDGCLHFDNLRNLQLPPGLPKWRQTSNSPLEALPTAQPMPVR